MFDVDAVQSLSVKAVQSFVNGEGSLDEVIAKISRGLNKDQLCRVIEASNTLAFLKLREKATDKAFEFPVASLAGVLGEISRPAVVGHVDLSPEVLEKSASTEVQGPLTGYSPELGYRACAHLKLEMEKLAQEAFEVSSALGCIAPQLVKQAGWADRVHAVAGSADLALRVTAALGGSGLEKSAEQFSPRMFSRSELSLAEEVVGLVKRAQDLNRKMADLTHKEESLLEKVAKDIRPVSSSFHPERLPAAGLGWLVAAPAKAAWSTGKSVGKSLKGAGMGSGTVLNGGLAALTREPKINPHTGRPNTVTQNIYG